MSDTRLARTMINTYPDSRHAAEADRLLQDPKPEGCLEPDHVWIEHGSVDER